MAATEWLTPGRSLLSCSILVLLVAEAPSRFFCEQRCPVCPGHVPYPRLLRWEVASGVSDLASEPSTLRSTALAALEQGSQQSGALEGRSGCPREARRGEELELGTDVTVVLPRPFSLRGATASLLPSQLEEVVHGDHELYV